MPINRKKEPLRVSKWNCLICDRTVRMDDLCYMINHDLDILCSDNCLNKYNHYESMTDN